MSKRVHSFDTLRFLSIFIIILYHYFGHYVSGGFLGVNVFFVLSGFLLARRGEDRFHEGVEESPSPFSKIKSSLKKSFFPMLLMVLLSILFLVVFRPDLLVNIKGTVASSLLFLGNWYQIFSGKSYFATYLNPSIFTHLWYLSAYIQIIILWYLLYPPIRRFFGKRKKLLMTFILGLAVLSALWMAYLAQPGEDPTRVYYGTDTRIFDFLVGVFFGLAVDLPRVKSWQRLSEGQADTILLALFLVILAFVFGLTDQSLATYRGGMFIFDLLLGAFILILSIGGSRVSRFFTFKPFVFLGQRSSSMYLWYYPIYIIFYAKPASINFFTSNPWLQILVIILFGLVFEYLILGPVLRAIKGFPPMTRDYWPKFWTYLGELNGAQNLFILACLAVGGIVAFSPTSDEAATLEAESTKRVAWIDEKNAEQAVQEEEVQDFEPIQRASQEDLEAYQGTLSAQELSYYNNLSNEAARFALNAPVTFIGDSLTVGASEGIYSLYPRAIVGADIGVQMSNVADRIEKMKEDGQLNQVVVINLGSNGSFTSTQLEEVIEIIGPERDLFFVTTHVERPWAENVNALLFDRALQSEEDNVYIVDWNNFYTNQWSEAGILEEDGAHLTAQGYNYYVAFVTEVLNEYVPE